MHLLNVWHALVSTYVVLGLCVSITLLRHAIDKAQWRKAGSDPGILESLMNSFKVSLARDVGTALVAGMSIGVQPSPDAVRVVSIFFISYVLASLLVYSSALCGSSLAVTIKGKTYRISW